MQIAWQKTLSLSAISAVEKRIAFWNLSVTVLSEGAIGAALGVIAWYPLGAWGQSV